MMTIIIINLLNNYYQWGGGVSWVNKTSFLLQFLTGILSLHCQIQPHINQCNQSQSHTLIVDTNLQQIIRFGGTISRVSVAPRSVNTP